MASARDVACYLLSKGAQSALRLQKLLYYAQAWSLVWDGRALFSETIRAWDMGPVVGEVWYAFRSHELCGDPSRLTAAERETVDAVVDYYGAQPETWLSELSHRERPWGDAYVRGARPSPVIALDAMKNFYGRLPPSPSKRVPDAYRRGAEVVMSLSPDELAELGDDEDSGVEVRRFLREQA
jgi:uncharacterized phage-associated protein